MMNAYGQPEPVGGLKSTLTGPESPVLPAGCIRQTGVPVPQFHQDIWDLRAGVTRDNALPARSILDFTLIRDPVRRITVKELLFAMLNVRIPGKKRVRSTAAVYLGYFDLRAFFRFIDSRFGPVSLASVTQPMLDEYAGVARVNQISGGEVAPSRWAQKLDILVDLKKYERFLSYDALSIEPWNGRRPGETVEPLSRSENRTPRIPEHIAAPLLAGALRYVNEYASEIFSAREAQTALLAAAGSGTRALGEGEERGTAEAIRAWLCACRAANSGVPRHNSGTRMAGRFRNRGAAGEDVDVWEYVNLRRIAHLAGVGYMPLYRCTEARALIRAAADELGWEGDLSQALCADAPTTLTSLRGSLYGEVLLIEERMLLTACYLLIGYLTGMRDSEVHSLRVGCHHTERSGDGTIYRHRVKGRVYKGGHLQGREANWVAIEPVATAVAVATRLLEQHRQSGEGELFTVPHGHGKGNALRPWRLLNDFRDHINRLAERHPALARVPDHGGEPWNLNSRQLRRTLAWHIANLPYGVVALKIQYKHVHVATSEGYAGTSESGFGREIEIEEAEARSENILDRFADFCDGVRVTGPGAARVESEFTRVLKEIGGKFAGTIADRARVRAMLMMSDAVLHIGLFNDCYFVPATALCLRNTDSSGTKKVLPVIAMCEPTKCTNSCIGKRHRKEWERVRDDAQLHLRTPHLGEPQRVSLEWQFQRAEKVLLEVS